MEGDQSDHRKNVTEDYSAEALPFAKSAVEEDPLTWRLSLESFRIEKQDTDRGRQTWSSFLRTSSTRQYINNSCFFFFRLVFSDYLYETFIMLKGSSWQPM
ncbi:hypothetical protein Peur_017654 [Populus x canadensis]